MSLPRFSVNNPIAANLLMLLLLIGGLIFAFLLPRELFPELDLKMVQITVPYPGSTPAEVEKGMAIKIEEAVHDLDGIKKIRTSIYEGGASISVEFETDIDLDQALNDVRAEIDRLDNLPPEAEEIEIRRVEMLMPVISIAIYGDTTERNLKELAEQLREDLLEFGGVTEANVTDVRDPEISIEVQPALLEKYDLTFQEVASQVGADNLDIPGGRLKAAEGDIRVRTLGEQENVHQLEDIILRADPDGQTVRLGDVAVVIDGFKDTVKRGRYMGQPSARVMVMKRPDQDAITIATRVREFVAANENKFSGNVKIGVRDDTSQFIDDRLGLLIKNAIFGLILVFLSLTVFLNIRVAFWAAMGVPVAILGTFIILRFIGYSSNLITMFGLIVILGMVVDDAIVLGENVFRRFQEGMSPMEAAIKGSEEVAVPVLATVLTTIAAFSTLAFIDGTMGEMMRPIAGTVVAALLVSMLEAFIILPAHLAHTLRKVKRAAIHDDEDWVLDESVNQSWWRRLGAKKEYFLDIKLRNFYTRILAVVIDWRYVSIAVAISLLMITMISIMNGRPRVVMMQDMDSDMVTANLEMATGTPVEKTVEALAVVEAAAMDLSEILSVYSMVGDQINMRATGPMGGSNDADPATIGQVMIELQPAENRDRHSDVILAELRSKTGVIPGMSSLEYETVSGMPTGPDFEIRVRGDEIDTINRAVEYVKTRLSRFEGVEDIRDNMNAGKLEARLALNPVGRIAGVTVRDLAMQMRSAVFGAEAQTLQRGREEVEVYVRLTEESRDSIGDVQNFRVSTPMGGRVPLGELASLDVGRGFDTLSRMDRKRSVTIEAKLDQNKTSSSAAEIAIMLEAEMSDIGNLYPGVSLFFGGEREEMAKSFGSMIWGFLVAMIIIYVILALVFGSYVQPFTIMTAVPFGLVGAAIGHIVMGYPMTMMSFIGLIALSGVVVNDSLILIDFVNRARKRGTEVRDAILLAGRKRLRPIILTSVTTILGLAPLMAEQSFSAQMLIPMAVSIAFGLAFATVLTLLIVPCFYYILDDLDRLAHASWNLAWHGSMIAPHEPTAEVSQDH